MLLIMKRRYEYKPGKQPALRGKGQQRFVRNLSRSEMLSLFSAHELRVEKCEATKIRQELASWMALTKTPENVQEDILCKMKEDLSGGKKTGFYPYVMDGKICFDQRWVLTIGIKL